jgi:hypothetical protein
MEGEVRNPTFGVWNVLATMQTTPTLFKNFNELAFLVVPNPYHKNPCYIHM